MFVHLDLLVKATDFLQIGSKHDSSVVLKSVQITTRPFEGEMNIFDYKQ